MHLLFSVDLPHDPQVTFYLCVAVHCPSRDFDANSPTPQDDCELSMS